MLKRMKIENDLALYFYVYCKINKENKKICATLKKIKDPVESYNKRDIFQVKKKKTIPY